MTELHANIDSTFGDWFRWRRGEIKAKTTFSKLLVCTNTELKMKWKPTARYFCTAPRSKRDIFLLFRVSTTDFELGFCWCLPTTCCCHCAKLFHVYAAAELFDGRWWCWRAGGGREANLSLEYCLLNSRSLIGDSRMFLCSWCWQLLLLVTCIN